MVIRKPNLTVTDVKRLAATRSTASSKLAEAEGGDPESAAPKRPDGKHKRPSINQESIPQPDQSNNRAIAKIGSAILAKPKHASQGKPRQATTHQSRHAAKISNSTKPAAARPKNQAMPPLLPPAEEKVQVFLSALLPAPGISPTFELICRRYPVQKALQMILRKALDEYEHLLANGNFQELTTNYPSSEITSTNSVVQTSRMMPAHLADIARAHFDPLGLESTRAFGRMLGTAALAAFFAKEIVAKKRS